MTRIEAMEKFLMNEAVATLEDIKAAYNDMHEVMESYEEWLQATAEVNGYKEV